MRLIRSHLTYANVISTLCLVLIVGGGVAYAANTVFSADIVDGEVKAADLGANAVTETKIAGGAVVNGKLKNDAVTSPKVLNETLVGGDVKDNALKGADIDESTLSNIGGGGPAGGDLTGTYPNPLIAPDAVGSAEVDDNSLTADDIGLGAIGTDELQEATFFESQRAVLNDDVGGSATQVELVAPPAVGNAYRMVAECSESPAGTIQARVLVSKVGISAGASTLAVDSTAPNGTDDATGVNTATTPVPLIGVGPAGGSHWDSGSYSLQAFVPVDDLFAAFSGVVAAGTNIASQDCVFAVTGRG